MRNCAFQLWFIITASSWFRPWEAEAQETASATHLGDLDFISASWCRHWHCSWTSPSRCRLWGSEPQLVLSPFPYEALSFSFSHSLSYTALPLQKRGGVSYKMKRETDLHSIVPQTRQSIWERSQSTYNECLIWRHCALVGGILCLWIQIRVSWQSKWMKYWYCSTHSMLRMVKAKTL